MLYQRDGCSRIVTENASGLQLGLCRARLFLDFRAWTPVIEPTTPPRPLDVPRLGLIAYGDALALQADLVTRRRAGEIADTLLLEPPHVITLGSGSHDKNVLVTEEERRERGIELFETGRGGDVTYHGPGQLVGDPIRI